MAQSAGTHTEGVPLFYGRVTTANVFRLRFSLLPPFGLIIVPTETNKHGKGEEEGDAEDLCRKNWVKNTIFGLGTVTPPPAILF